MHNMKRKIMAGAMAALMAIQPMTAFAATELTNSTASSFTEDVNGYDTVGEDATQEKVAKSKEITDITDSTYAAEEEAEVYATQSSKFSVIIPKIITLDGQTKQGNYQVAVKGDLSGNQEVSITPDEQVTLYEQNASADTKDSVVADISQSKVTWNQSEIDREEYKDSGVTTGVVSAGGITAGSWAGKFNFNIELENGAEEEAEVDENIIRMNYTGPNFNTGIKQLVDESATCETQDTRITEIKTTDVQPSKGTKIIYFMATEADTEPYLKAYLDEKTVKLYTKSDTVMLPEDSSYMFSNLRGLTGTFDLRTFDASNVTDMSYMFNWCGEQSMTTLDLGDKFDTSNVTNMRDMFEYCGYSKMTTLDLGNKFDTSKVTNMGSMFIGCGRKSMTTLDLGDKFDTSNVTNMRDMFEYCGYTAMTTLDLGNKFDTSNVTDMRGMFKDCGYTAMTTLDLGNKFDTSKVIYMREMFRCCGYAQMTSLDLGDKFNTSKVITMENMFRDCGCEQMTSLDLGDKFDTSNVTNMNCMFKWCGYSKMTTLDLGDKFDTSKVTNMGSMFSSCGYTKMTTLDLGDKFNTSKVTDMSSMFSNCGYTAMTTLDLGDKFNTSKVTNMSSMFSNCGYTAMTTLNLGNKFDITQVSCAAYTFQNCGRMKMTSLDLGPKFIPTSRIDEGTTAKPKTAIFAGTGTDSCVITAPQVAADYFNAMSYDNQRILTAKSYE